MGAQSPAHALPADAGVSTIKWDTAAVARFEGREPVRPRSVQVPRDTTHANVERPPHTDPGPEAPPARAVLTI